MKKRRFLASVSALALLALVAVVGLTYAQGSGPGRRLTALEDPGTAFTYQGFLTRDGNPVDDTCDFWFALWNEGTGGAQVGPSLNPLGVPVDEGRFTVQLDFGEVFDGTPLWLQIEVQCSGDTEHTTLSPRQLLTPAPYAAYARSAGALQGRPVTATAPITGQVLAWDGALWAPAADADTTYSAGAGLVLSGTLFSANTTYLQRRVGSVCGAGSAIREIGADGTVVCEPTGSGAYWSLTGNGGTTPGAHFLGTTDGVSLTLAVSGTVGWRLEPTGGTPNIIGGYDGNSVAPGVVGATIGGGGSSGGTNRVTDDYGTVGGGGNNQAGDGVGTTSDADHATVAGGQDNTASGDYATVGGGWSNTASHEGATVAGGVGNAAGSDFVTIGGGSANIASAEHAIVTGGSQNTASNDYATICGGWYNTANGHGTTIAGGYSNVASGPIATVGGGNGNTAGGPGAVVGGGGYDGFTWSGNQALAPASTIGGGSSNLITTTAFYATVGGGRSNTAGGPGAVVGGGGYNGAFTSGNQALASASTIGGGYGNLISTTAAYATVGGGERNTASRDSATVGGGHYNTASGGQATVGGGYYNTASGGQATVGGGGINTASDPYATVGGGYSNQASGAGSFVGGGGYDGITAAGNQALAPASTIAGGLGNTITTTASYATVGGGWGNTANDDYVTVGGGSYNTASGDYATVGGGWSNTASGRYATVGGGERNTASGYHATVGGGLDNTAAAYATVGGGEDNIASGWNATVGGGRGNTANDDYVTVGGGSYNTASGDYATVGGGWSNTASGRYATVGGGYDNTASGLDATVPGGLQNTAAGDYSFAAGHRARANNQGCFVWGDSTAADVTCSDDNRTIFRSSGGYYIYSSSGLTTGLYLAAGGGSWNSLSDRSRKENFQPVDAQALLEGLAVIPITTWNYTGQDPAIRHIGPTAQDFNGLLPDLGGEGEEYINSLDADGVALAGIQGLYEQNQEQTARIESLEAENGTLQAQVDDLEARLAALEAEVNGLAPPTPLQSGLLPGAGLLLLTVGAVWAVQRRGKGVGGGCGRIPPAAADGQGYGFPGAGGQGRADQGGTKTGGLQREPQALRSVFGCGGALAAAGGSHRRAGATGAGERQSAARTPLLAQSRQSFAGEFYGLALLSSPSPQNHRQVDPFPPHHLRS